MSNYPCKIVVTCENESKYLMVDNALSVCGIAYHTELIKNEQISLPASSANNIFALFDKAKESLKWPKIRFQDEAGTKIVISMAGPKATIPGSLNVTDGGSYGVGKFYARIRRESNIPSVQYYPAATSEIKSLIDTILSDPLGVAKMVGLKYSNCCFCGLELTNKNSLTVGYGPICAEKWGLPWEGTADEKEAEELRKNL